MASTRALGFAYLVVAAPDGSRLTDSAVLAAINAAAASRGIQITPEGSDALDAARDIIVADAVSAAGGGGHAIVGDTLYVAAPESRSTT